MKRWSWFSLIVALLSSVAIAETITVDNSTNSQVDIGTGADGAFSDGPSQTGISVSGSTITIDTDTKAIYNFTSFQLSSTFTINVTGSEPLTIRALTDVTIAGTINLNGEDGGDTGVSINGGASAGGGGAGGNGGVSNGGSQPTDGEPSTGNARGGTAGTNQAGPGAQRAGGGGCLGSGAVAGDNNAGSAGACTLTQEQIAGLFDTSFTGGGGGSGGGARSGAVGGNGAGGGSAGGGIHIASGISLTLSGTISAIGGAGGDGNFSTTDCGASGGGGSGGSVWIQVGDLIQGNGTIDVSAGAGGVDGICSYDGGAGSRGVVRLDRGRTSFAGTVSPLGDFDVEYDLNRTGEFDLQGAFYCGSISIGNGNDAQGVMVLLFWLMSLFVIYRVVRMSSRLTVPRSN